MASVDEISIKLGIQAGDLKAALLDANARIQGTKKQGSDDVGALEKLFDKLGDKVAGTRDVAHAVATAVGLNIEKMASTIAQLLTGVSEQSSELYKKLGELSTQLADKQIDEMRHRATLENQITLTKQDQERAQNDLNKAREDENKQLTTTQILLHGIMSPAASIYELAVRRRDIEKSLTEQVDATNQLIKTTAESDRLATEEKKKQETIAGTLRTYNQQEADHAAKILGYQAQIAALQKTLTDAKEALAKAEAGSVEQGKLLLEVQKARFALDDAELKHKQQIAGSTAEQLEYLNLIHKVSLGIATGPEEQRLKLIKEQRQEREVESQILDLVNKSMTEKLSPADEKRLADLEKQKTKLDEQLETGNRLLAVANDRVSAEDKVAQKLKEQADEAVRQQAAFDAFTSKDAGSFGFESMSDAMLQGIIAKQQKVLNTVTAQGVLTKNASMQDDYGAWFASQSAGFQINSAQLELSNRAAIRSTVATAGQNAAIMQYGDSAVSRAMASMSTDTKNLTATVGSVVQILNNVFPNQAVSIPPIH